MDPSIWGPHLWYVLHIITFAYPKEPSEYDKRRYGDFFNVLKDIIPCDICQKHLIKYMAEYPIGPHLDSKADLIKWLIQIHNFVNVSLGKPVHTPAEVVEIYKNINPISPFYNVDENEIREKRRFEKTKQILYLLLFISVVVIIVLKYNYKRNYYYY